jgi:hypothetical protein
VAWFLQFLYAARVAFRGDDRSVVENVVDSELHRHLHTLNLNWQDVFLHVDLLIVLAVSDNHQPFIFVVSDEIKNEIKVVTHSEGSNLWLDVARVTAKYRDVT